MKIGLNGQHILIDNPAGPERFTINLYKHLARNDKKNQYIVYFDNTPSKDFWAELTSSAGNFNYKVIPQGFLWTQLRLAAQTLKDDLDILFMPIHTLPFLRNPKTKTVTVIHGLEYKTNKQLSLSLKKLIHPFVLWYTINAADKVVVPSNATKDSVIKSGLLVNKSKLQVINEGVSEEFYPRKKSEVLDVLERHGLEYKKYLLFISTIQPRKNIINLVHAFANALKTNSREDINLVLVGKPGWKYDEIFLAPKKFDVEQNVKFLHWVSQEDLPLLLSGALGYTNVSLDEGFGLTVLEAMATQIPVVASNIPAHNEVGGETIIYANPNNVDEITDALLSVINDEYPASLVETAAERSKRFTWEQTAKKFTEIFSLLKRH